MDIQKRTKEIYKETGPHFCHCQDSDPRYQTKTHINCNIEFAWRSCEAVAHDEAYKADPDNPYFC